MNKHQSMFLQLKELQKNSVATFSNYKVAAIIETDAGEFKGVNVEPSVMNLGVCAERNALFSALTFGSKVLKNVYLLTDSVGSFGSPCGACRQLLLDYANEDTNIIMFNLDGEYQEVKLYDLVPMMWTKSELN
ncbi:cytidine deaminase family protein [Ureaplasma ceti]|uniref:Cytidine deaminase n=1 Tax=Ureaplasma ceti TaxID=3119530 RepID=A0ABP9UBC6_9BACT